MELSERIRHARRAGVPLVAVETPDPAQTLETVKTSVNGKAGVVAWDCIRGLLPVNEAGRDALGTVDAEQAEGNPVGLLEVAAQLPDGTVCVMQQADAWIAEAPVAQGLWNLRDSYKQTRRMFVLLGTSVVLPASLARDIVVMGEALPGGAELERIARELDGNACEALPERPAADDETIGRAVDAVQGLSAFGAEQAIAMSLRKTGIDLTHLWESKRKMIELTPGLSVWRGGERFDDVGGLDNVKGFMGRVLAGQDAPRGVVFIDEIEKMLAGSGGTGGADTSGVSQGILQALLTHMQDNNATGSIFVGPPGAGKSMIAKTIGNEGGIPTIALDSNAMKSSLVGDSERSIREALRIVSAVTGGRALWVATCNAIADLPPELRRRFAYGTFFFDLPTAEERATIWAHYTRACGVYEPQTAVDFDTGWTGAEIRTCCQLAYRLQISLAEASRYIVPVAKSARQQIEELRRQADGRFISATHAGVYRPPAASEGKRSVEL